MRGLINLDLSMNKVLLFFAALFTCVGVYAHDYKLVIPEEIPSEARTLLTQRFTQMLQGGGHAVVEEGTPVNVSFEILDRMETPGSMSQVALNIVVKAVCEGVKAEFPITGVGEDEADAWLRAVKRLLPRSKEAQKFVQELK